MTRETFTMHRLFALALSLALATPAQAAQFQFCWVGGAGYTMRGTISFPDALLGTGLITQDQVTGFTILGFHDGVPVGGWSLDQLKPDTTWVMSFDTTALAFPTGGSRAQGSYQAWNANGQVNDCGPNGFGFNGGNWAQDVCIDNTYIEVSSIDRYTPLPVHAMDVELSCTATLSLS